MNKSVRLRQVVFLCALGGLVALLRWFSTGVEESSLELQGREDVAISPQDGSEKARLPARKPRPPASRSGLPVLQGSFQIVDEQNGRPFKEAVTVSVNGIEYQANDRGQVQDVALQEDLQSNEILVKAPRSFAPDFVPCDLKRSSLEGRGTKTLIAVGKLYARIELHTSFTDVPPGRLIVEILSLPESQWIAAEEAEWDFFISMPRQMLDAARQRLGDPALPIETERFVFDLKANPAEPITFLSTLGGDVVVTVAAEADDGGVILSSPAVPATFRTFLHRGETTRLEAVLRPRPQVHGKLTDGAGNPLPGRKVTVAVRRHLSRGEMLPRWADEPNSSALLVVSDPKGDNRWAVIHRTVRTDKDGKFASRMLFDGDQAAWAFVRGHSMAYQEAPGGTTDGEGLHLVAPRAPEKRWIKVVDEEGQPLSGLSFEIVHSRPPHSFQLKFPRFRTNSQGMLDATWIPPEGVYYLFLGERGFKEQKDVSLARDILVLPRRTSPR